ncbi:MAG: hypothetical protein ACOX32_01905 [Bacteroidaceae bacterium]|jgi:hypothetical protein|nr:hypothetical protein [Bacteroidaceae bacterium]MBP8602363.1 hypothetical protein [Bacteroidaceae bacterium]OPZ47547.1 MAG: hypothetical protein BWY95_01410 [Bacteroidetes bacterium ADurb.BinA104]
MDKRYEKILNLPYQKSAARQQMSLYNRAAQFSPFASLTGYEAIIDETARLTDSRIELDENQKTLLDACLQELASMTNQEITVTFFKPDSNKQGGKYTEITGQFNSVCHYKRMLSLTDGTSVPLDDITAIVISDKADDKGIGHICRPDKAVE